MISAPLIEELLREMRESLGFVISMRRGHPWYFHKLEEEPIVTGVIWTPYITRAKFFPNERSVEEFKAQFISPRKVEILRITRE